MAGSTNNQANIGAYIVTTNVWDVQPILSSNLDPQLKELFVRLYQNLGNMANIINVKDTGIYTNDSIVVSQQYFPNPTAQNQEYRQVYRAVIDCGPLANTGTTSTAHNIQVTSNTIFTRIYGCSTNPGTDFIPLPYASATLVNNIELDVDNSNINITTAADYSAYIITYVVVEYIQS